MPASKQQDVTVEELNQLIHTHMEERDWLDSSSRSLAISLVLEATELLEHYQWSETPVGGVDAVGDELADVMMYSIQLAQRNNIDIVKHIRSKLEKSALKYPAADFKGKNRQEQHDAWQKNKIAHKKEGL